MNLKLQVALCFFLDNIVVEWIQDAAPRESAYSRADVSSVIPHATMKKLFLTNGDSEGKDHRASFVVA